MYDTINTFNMSACGATSCDNHLVHILQIPYARARRSLIYPAAAPSQDELAPEASAPGSGMLSSLPSNSKSYKKEKKERQTKQEKKRKHLLSHYF